MSKIPSILGVVLLASGLMGCDTEDFEEFIDDITDPSQDYCPGIGDLRQAALDEINAARALSRNCGNDYYSRASELTWNSRIYEAALDHAKDMAEYNYLAHTGSDGSNPGQRLDYAGYDWRSYGENVGAGYNSVESVVENWLDSPGHCANLMNEDAWEFALACADAPDSADYDMYWTLVLAEPW